ncbi:OmpA/MotB family protein [Desulfoplanes formicivorans]|uniref:Flagellar motor protein MotB n=1 Tax=Desulfoplanes formicivorans TaxID=1592317 RepID=A0A194AGP8_9BACT|nr:flagellar motor protein MotB [Desulfoplanes formicivorans]GAU08385.1 flagellar motor protein MotB [Desulfoplanes formicivorans]
MGRKRTTTQSDDGSPAWLITFSDLMTLLLTFFVLLLSLASLMDERKTKTSIGSIMGSFGPSAGSVQPLTTKAAGSVKESGPLENLPAEDLEPLRELIWEDDGQDFDFQSNRFIQVFSVDTEVLFDPGSSNLSSRGLEILGRIVPVVRKVKYPLLITGHTASLRSELSSAYVAGQSDKGVDLSWNLSLQRVLNVYRTLVARGIQPEKLRMEAFGRFRPRATNTTPEGRRANRRVEFVLDRRNTDWSHEMARKAGSDGQHQEGRFMYNDFIFTFNATQAK